MKMSMERWDVQRKPLKRLSPAKKSWMLSNKANTFGRSALVYLILFFEIMKVVCPFPYFMRSGFALYGNPTTQYS